MNNFQLTIITKNQNKKEKAEKLAKTISAHLSLNKELQIEKYPKFESSYKIELSGILNDGDSIRESIKLANRLCSPWTVMYDDESEDIELIFNKSQDSRYKNEAFNTIEWAHFYL